MTQAVLAPNPPGAVLKRHRSNVDRNTFIGIVSPFKRRLGVALAATGRLGWLAGRPFDPCITCTGWAPHQAGASDGASHHGGAERSDGCRFLLFLIIEHKAAFLADESASSS